MNTLKFRNNLEQTIFMELFKAETAEIRKLCTHPVSAQYYERVIDIIVLFSRNAAIEYVNVLSVGGTEEQENASSFLEAYVLAQMQIKHQYKEWLDDNRVGGNLLTQDDLINGKEIEEQWQEHIKSRKRSLDLNQDQSYRDRRAPGDFRVNLQRN